MGGASSVGIAKNGKEKKKIKKKKIIVTVMFNLKDVFEVEPDSVRATC